MIGSLGFDPQHLVNQACGAHLQSQHLGEEDKKSKSLKFSLTINMFEPILGYMKPCLKNEMKLIRLWLFIPSLFFKELN